MLSVSRCVSRHLAHPCCRSRTGRDIWTRSSRSCFSLTEQRRQLHPPGTSRLAGPPHDSKSRRDGVSNVSAEARKEVLAHNGFDRYPRMPQGVITVSDFENLYSDKDGTDFLETSSTEGHKVFGRVKSIRFAGNALAFADIEDQQGGHKLQVIVNQKHVSSSHPEAHSKTFIKDHMKILRPGDSICATGRAFRNKTDQLSLMTSRLPMLLSPCLHPIPTGSTSENADVAVERHAQQLADPHMLSTLVSRSMIINGISTYLNNCGFAAVQTPVLAASTGGATARPFTTTATEFSTRELAMRIAPELWLKRLIIGGMTKIFEIGQSFRNEGIDAMHNPEFTTCEFYTADWTLEDMLRRTQDMFTTITKSINSSPNEGFRCHSSWTRLVEETQSDEWPTIDFIPALNEVLGPEHMLPDLSSSSARDELLAIFEQKGLSLPTTPTLPRLLDSLCSKYLEPRCTTPAWIKNTPECLSPLAKSMAHPDLPHQRVAIRAELFINGHEVVNCYEEENDPEEQKRKFVEQQFHAHLPSQDAISATVDLEVGKVDHEYIRALEWGLPPIGGWGCGIDRLVMLMLGKDNIRDVLAFGNLRMVTRGADKIVKPA